MIEVTQDIKKNPFPIHIKLDSVYRNLTIKAAIELRRKLETAICDFQVDEAGAGES